MQAMQTTHAMGESHVQAMNRAPAHIEKGKFYRDRRTEKKNKEWSAQCNKCGRTHEPRQCPAYGAVCHNCNKQNHFAKMCAAPTERTVTRRGVHDLETEVDSLFIGTVSCVEVNAITRSRDTAWYTMASVMNIPVKFKIDTGADGNVLPMSIVETFPATAHEDSTGSIRR